MQVAQTDTQQEQGTAKADAGPRLAAAKGSQSLPAAATSQVPTEGPKTTAMAQAVTAAKQVANAAVTNAAPALVTAPAEL